LAASERGGGGHLVRPSGEVVPTPPPTCSSPQCLALSSRYDSRSSFADIAPGV
jgi:hypothetical protein